MGSITLFCGIWERKFYWQHTSTIKKPGLDVVAPRYKNIGCRVREQEKSKMHGHGTEVPREYPACKNYRECQFWVDSLPFKENAEAKVILSKLQLDNITLVEAYKTGPYAITPLRICMNSSMKQPLPSGVSLTNCLLGRQALADLYTVTLGIWEHRTAFTKDISKFYWCVEADETAQHGRKILWRFGDIRKESEVSVTTRVNYGDRPAGYVAIAAVREMAKRFSEGRRRWPGSWRTDIHWWCHRGSPWQEKCCEDISRHGVHHRERRILIQENSHDGWPAGWDRGALGGIEPERKLRGVRSPWTSNGWCLDTGHVRHVGPWSTWGGK